MDEYTNDASPQFDMGLGTVMRINWELTFLNQATIQDNPHEIYRRLINVYLEVIPFIIKKSGKYATDREKYHIDQKKKVETSFVQYQAYLNNPRGYKGAPRAIYDNLLEWNAELRKDLLKCDLLMRSGEKTGSAMV